MRTRRLSAVMLSLCLGAVSLPFAPGLVASAGAQTACPSPKVQLLINPTLSTLPTGQVVGTGGTMACVSLGAGVMGGNPLPSCTAPGVLVVVGAVVTDGTVTSGQVQCVSLSGTGVPTSPTGLLGLLLNLVSSLLSGLPLPPLPPLPIPSLPI